MNRISYTEREMVFTKDTNPFIVTDVHFETKYLLSILSSRLISYLYVNGSSIATKDDFRQTTLAELRAIRIKAPSQGSFIQDVLLVTAPVLADCAIQCSFNALLSYVWNLILPPSKASDVAVEIAKIELKRKIEDTKQEQERTKQIALMTQVANENSATTQQALSILDYAVKNQLTLTSDTYRLSREDIEAIRGEALANVDREVILKENQACFERITPEQERRLAGQLKKSIGDMALPLRSSAHTLSIQNPSATSEETSHVASLNNETASAIIEEQVDEGMTVLRGTVKSYDRENGYGKFRYDELKRPITFNIPSAAKSELAPKVIDALSSSDVLFKAYMIRDQYNNPVRLILDDILEEEVLDKLNLT